MSAGEIFWLFSAQAAAGVALLLPLVPITGMVRPFYRINIWVVLSAALLGHGVMALGWGQVAMREGWGAVEVGGFELAALVLGGLSVAAAAWALALVKRPDFERCVPALWLTGGLSVASLSCLVAHTMSRAAQVHPAFAALALPANLAGAALIGGVTLSMILGHYYLNQPKLPIDPLRRYNGALLIAAVARAALFCVGVGLAWGLEVPGPKPDRGFFLENTVLLCQRGLFGVVGPVMLAWMSWETVKIQSTQSATGILYGAMVLVAIGELTAGWIQGVTALPI